MTHPCDFVLSLFSFLDAAAVTVITNAMLGETSSASAWPAQVWVEGTMREIPAAYRETP